MFTSRSRRERHNQTPKQCSCPMAALPFLLTRGVRSVMSKSSSMLLDILFQSGKIASKPKTTSCLDVD